MNGYAQLAAFEISSFVLEQGIPAELEFDGKISRNKPIIYFLIKRPVATLRYERNTYLLQAGTILRSKEYRGKG